jgi:hypothetical protein
MSHHRNAICQSTGKVRYREPRDVKFALRRADGDRHRARMNDVECGRRETGSYSCTDCGGWHLTSQTARPARHFSRPTFTVHIPGPAADAIRRMATTTGLTTAVAA